MILPNQRGLPPLNFPPLVSAAISSLTAKQTISIRQRRRLLILRQLQSSCLHHTARELGHVPRTVKRWFLRGRQMMDYLADCATMPSPGDLERLLKKTVADAYREGGPLRYTSEQQCGIISLAVRKPAEFGLPVENWTHGELAEVADKEGIARGISRQSVTRMLAGCDLKPHRVKYWENPTIVDEQAFQEAVKEICAIYRQAPEALQNGVHTVSLDEKTGIQALERVHPDRPPKPGCPARIEFEYIRHGTQSLLAGFEVGNGKIVGAHVRDTRTEEDLAELVRAIIDTDPAAQWVFVLDRLNTHMSESLVRIVVELTGIQCDLGVRGKSGILKSLKSREEFLTGPAHRIRFFYTPKHCSWLNQIEVWFGILTRKALRRASFASLVELRERIHGFVEYFNKTMAKAFNWTYKGNILKA